MPPTAQAVANQNAAMRRNRRDNNFSSIHLTTTQPQHAPYFLGAPITKLLCMMWIVGSLVIIRNRGGKSYNTSILQRFFFPTTSELVVGVSFLAHYMRRLEREVSSRRLVVWLVVVQSFLMFVEIVAISTMEEDLLWTAQGPYAMVGAVLYWYWRYIPRVYPRFVSFLDMQFSEKTFGLAWAAYVLLLTKDTASLLMGALGFVGSALFFFLLMASPNLDMPNFMANLLPWSSLGNLLLLDADPRVFAPLLVVQRDNAGFGGMAAAFGGGRPARQQPAARQPRRPAPAPAAAPSPPAEAVAQLTAMGFEEARVKEALQVSGNNIERAANILLTG